MQINLREAKARLSELLDRASAGEAVEIVRHGAKPGRFRLIAAEEKSIHRKPGALKGQIWIADDFNDEDPRIENMFYGD